MDVAGNHASNYCASGAPSAGFFFWCVILCIIIIFFFLRMSTCQQQSWFVHEITSKQRSLRALPA